TREIDDFVARGYFGIILTGGEPSISPIVPEVTQYAIEHGLHVRMITNGSKIADPSLAHAFVNAGLKHYHVSIHSCREDVEDFLTGVKGSFSLAMRALENLTALDEAERAADRAPVTVNINTVINTFNCDHLDENV